VCGDQICAPDEINACQADCTPHRTCGDGVCSAFEEFANCPLDCDPPSATPSLTLIPTRTPILAATLEEASPLPATSEPEATEESTTEANTEPTATPTAAEEERGPTPTPTPIPANCRLVGSDAIHADVVEALVEVTGGYRPIYWVICDTPPDEVCIPFDPILAVPDANLDAMRLLDCIASGACTVFHATSLDEGEVCFQSTPGRDQPLCAEGCSFARVPTQPVLPSPPSLILLLLVLLIVGAMILIILLLLIRRRREREHEEILDADLGTT